MEKEKKKTSLQDMNVDLNPEWKTEEEEQKDAELEDKLLKERKNIGKKIMKGME